MEKVKQILKYTGISMGTIIVILVLFFPNQETLIREVLQNVENIIQEEQIIPEKALEKNYKVLNVIDGDTVKIDLNGGETIRLIGIDTPETVHPTKPVQCFGKEASQKAKDILLDQYVTLELDPSQGQTDKYGRTLGYLFLSNGENVNKMLIEEGYAYEYTYSRPYKYQSEFKLAEQEAKENKKGLWADGVCEKENIERF